VSGIDGGVGPLHGIRVLEFLAPGPVQMAGMLLADFGADVLQVDRTSQSDRLSQPSQFDVLSRSQSRVHLDLKSEEGLAAALRLAAHADVLLEGFRPGVMERLGMGPEICLAANPRIIYARSTGWGRSGPLAGQAGHDINFVGLSGALNSIGPADGPPVAPLSLVGDFGGGGLYLALGVCAGLVNGAVTGTGQVVDAAMVDGAASLMAVFYGQFAAGAFVDKRGSNLADGGAHFNTVYECSDARYVAVGAMEERFYLRFLRGLSLEPDDFRDRFNREKWPDYKRRIGSIFALRPRDGWVAHFAGLDACVSPVLSMGEAMMYSHNLERAAFVDVGGVVQPSPTPQFSESSLPAPLPLAVIDANEAAARWLAQSAD
jgi:alpha-methylacyl-CoA racemase